MWDRLLASNAVSGAGGGGVDRDVRFELGKGAASSSVASYITVSEPMMERVRSCGGEG